MKYGMVTIRKNDIENFIDFLPDYVLENCDKQGCFMIGAVDQDYNLVGLTQFYIGMLEDGNIISDVIYVYVNEDERNKGVASKMISKVHSILRKSGIDKSLAFLDEGQEVKVFFKGNGYLFMKVGNELVTDLKVVHEDVFPSGMEQGVCWIEQ